MICGNEMNVVVLFCEGHVEEVWVISIEGADVNIHGIVNRMGICCLSKLVLKIQVVVWIQGELFKLFN